MKNQILHRRNKKYPLWENNSISSTAGILMSVLSLDLSGKIDCTTMFKNKTFLNIVITIMIMKIKKTNPRCRIMSNGSVICRRFSQIVLICEKTHEMRINKIVSDDVTIFLTTYR